MVAAIALTGCVQAGAGSPDPATAAGPSVMHDAPATDPHPTPVGPAYVLGGSCAATESSDRCQAMAFAAARDLGVPFDAIVAVDVLRNLSLDAMDRSHPTFLSIVLADGSRHDITISCPGIAAAFDPKCMAFPTVQISYPGGAEGGGYTDTPENATPFPALDQQAVAQAQALRIALLPISVSETGPRSVELGTALLANGYLAEGRFSLADPWPSDVLFTAGPRMEVRPTSGGRPLQNLYEHGWQDGVEEVEVTISFDVAWFEPGAILRIVDVVVR